jgi:hypothetical protein
MNLVAAVGLRELGAVLLLTVLWIALGTVFTLVVRWIRRQPDDPRGL